MQDYIDRSQEIINSAEMTRTEQASAMTKLLREILDKKEPNPQHWPGMYMPTRQDTFYCINPKSEEEFESYSFFSQESILKLNALPFICKTKEEVVFLISHYKAKRDLIEKIADINKGWIPEWNNEKEIKIYFYYCRKSNRLKTEHTYSDQVVEDCFYFRYPTMAISIENELGAERIKLALWPEYKEKDGTI